MLIVYDMPNILIPDLSQHFVFVISILPISARDDASLISPDLATFYPNQTLSSSSHFDRVWLPVLTINTLLPIMLFQQK